MEAFAEFITVPRLKNPRFHDDHYCPRVNSTEPSWLITRKQFSLCKNGQGTNIADFYESSVQKYPLGRSCTNFYVDGAVESPIIRINGGLYYFC